MDCISFTQHYIQEKQEMQQTLLNYIDNEENVEEYYSNLLTFIKVKQITEDKSELKIFLNLLIRIANFHYRSSDFFNKIEKILYDFKEDIMKHLTNSEIFNLFQSNKRILLFLFENKIIIFDHYIYLKIYEEDEYLSYFYPEISDYNKNNKSEGLKLSSDTMKPLIELISSNIEEFNSKRKIGENDTYICQLIRNDDIDGFISYFNKNNISINSDIQNSIFDTNHFMSHFKKITLIDYAGFFGSIQIFRYLFKNNARFTYYSFPFAFHGRNPEIILILEKHESKKSFLENWPKSIKCFHNEVANYIIKNYFLNDSEIQSKLDSEITYHAIKYHNFDFITLNNNIYQYINEFCKYGFTSLVNYLIEETDAIQCIYTDLYYLETRCSLLYNIIKNEHFEIMKMLLDKKLIDINAEFYYLNKKISIQYIYNLLFLAASQNNYEMVKFLISQPGIDINYQHTYCYVQYSQSVVQENKRIEEDSKSFWETKNDSINIESLKSIFDYNRPSFYTPLIKTVLQLSVEYKTKKIVEILLNHPDINVNCKMIIQRNIVFFIISDFNIFIERAIQITKTPLITAIENEDLETVCLLLSHPKIDVNLKLTSDIKYLYKYFNRSNKEKNNFTDFLHERKTPLCAAIITNNYELVKLLLTNDDIDIKAQSVLINNFPHYFLSFDFDFVERDPKNFQKYFSEITEEATNPVKLATKQNNNDILNLLNNK